MEGNGVTGHEALDGMACTAYP